jgi:hypothetical protein
MKLLILLSFFLTACVEYTNENRNIQNMTQQDLIQNEFDDLIWRIKIHSDDKFLITGIKFPQNVHRLSRGGFNVKQRDDGLYKITWEVLKND